MGMDFKINECGEIIRATKSSDDLSRYEDALLRGDKLNVDIRKKVAKETRNETVLWRCIRDVSLAVVIAAKVNPILTAEMKSAIAKIEKDRGAAKQSNIQKDGCEIGCLLIMIIAGILGLFIFVV